jgi:molecular chaperone Hsp33
MIQALPEVSFDEFEDLRKIFESEEAIEHFSKLESMEPEHVEALLKGLGFPEHNTKLLVHQKLVPNSFCECNRNKIVNVLLSLPIDELEDMIESDGGAQIDCQFCSTCYQFDAQDLRKIIDGKQS